MHTTLSKSHAFCFTHPASSLSVFRPPPRMALPSASITRFDLSGHQKVTGILHGSMSPVLIRSIRRGKLHHTISRSGSRCLLNVTVPCSIQSALMTASATPYDPSRCVQPSLPIIPQNPSAALSEYIQGLVIADIDPAIVKLAISVTGPFLSAFGFLFILRIIMSWYPKLPVKKFPYIIAYFPTEPFLSITRKVIPPLAGVDVTPVVWFGLVSFLNEILVGPQGLLVLLSQQV
ncbi:YGGT family [Musa troglodytarum]|uniref:YGGT family n=1 Tax=Musa troglodytarum TaxID=320322 RepID=A0A9E7GZ46_9LILI|nr:YGGT family [Musa troglodytarum]